MHFESKHYSTPIRFLKFAWNNFYPIEEPNDLYKNQTYNNTNENIHITSGDAYFYQCYFYDMHSPTDGGALLYEKAQSNLLIEKCSFLRCRSDDDTSCIRVNKGNCILSKICCQFGSAAHNDGFCSIAAGNSNREIDSLFDSSISRCTAENSYIASHQYGFIHIKSINLSNNQARIVSSLCDGGMGSGY